MVTTAMARPFRCGIPHVGRAGWPCHVTARGFRLCPGAHDFRHPRERDHAGRLASLGRGVPRLRPRQVGTRCQPDRSGCAPNSTARSIPDRPAQNVSADTPSSPPFPPTADLPRRPPPAPPTPPPPRRQHKSRRPTHPLPPPPPSPTADLSRRPTPASPTVQILTPHPPCAPAPSRRQPTCSPRLRPRQLTHRAASSHLRPQPHLAGVRSGARTASLGPWAAVCGRRRQDRKSVV